MYVNSISLKVLAIALVAATVVPVLANAESRGAPRPLDLASRTPPGFDRRIDAIARDPSFLARLDQRRSFRTDEKYEEILDHSLAAVRRVLPAIISPQPDLQLSTALSVGDRRVFFWASAPDRDIVGWIPMQDPWSRNIRLMDRLPPDEIVLWVVPRIGSKSRLAEKLTGASRSVVSKQWTRDVLSAALDVEVEDIEVDSTSEEPVANSSFRRRDQKQENRGRHSIQVMSTGNVLQAKVRVRSEDESEWLPKPPIPRKYTNDDVPFRLPPSWPPPEHP